MRSVPGGAAVALLAGALAGCAASPEPVAASDPSRFDALMRYVPPGLESLMLAEHVAPLPGLAPLTADALRTLQCAEPGEVVSLVQGGGRFAHLGATFCDMEAVLVVRYRDHVPADWDRTREDRSRIASVGGRRVLYTPSPTRETGLSVGSVGSPYLGSPYRWCTPVSEDTLLFATHRRLLEQALKLPGTSAVAAAAALGWSTGVPWDASLILVRRFDPENCDDLASPVAGPRLSHERRSSTGPVPRRGLEGFVLCIPAAQAEMQVRVRVKTSQEDAPGALEWFGGNGVGPSGTKYKTWHTKDAASRHDGTYLSLESTFGPEDCEWRWAPSIQGLFGYSPGM